MTAYRKTALLITAFLLSLGTTPARAIEWSTTELQLQYGDLKIPFQGGGEDAYTGGTGIVTFQYANGWKYGDNFLFVDYLMYGKTDLEEEIGQATKTEFYGEWYPNFSLGKMTGESFSFLFIKDLGILTGFNFVPVVNNLYYLPGIRFALDLPGFAFANLDVTAYIPDSKKTVPGVAGLTLKEDNGYMIDFNWALPFKIGVTSWSIEGHLEYMAGADMTGNDNGFVFKDYRESWILAQPQIRLDIGELIYSKRDQLFAGIEYQFWINKLGDKDTDESIAQALVVWRF